MAEPQIELKPNDFCALKHTLEVANKTMSSEQLLEVADDMHEEIRERGDDPKSGPSNCSTAT
jgi:DNA-binding response OmpR family regulator